MHITRPLAARSENLAQGFPSNHQGEAKNVVLESIHSTRVPQILIRNEAGGDRNNKGESSLPSLDGLYAIVSTLPCVRR